MIRYFANKFNLNSKDLSIIFCIFLFALLARLILVDVRAIHHDEALHAYYSWNLATGYGFEHNPLMHGPLWFHLNSLLFFLLGDSNFILRLLPVIGGSFLVITPFLFTRMTGKIVAYSTSALLITSPILLYYSRFARNDILIVFVTILIIYSIFSYINSKTFSNKTLIYLASLLSIGFCIKETQYISIFLLGLFSLFFSRFNPLLYYQKIKISSQESKKWTDIFLLLFTLSLPLATPLIGVIVQSFTKITMIADVKSGLDIGMPDGSGIIVAIISTIIMLLISATIGYLWKGKTWFLIALFFWLIYLIFYTTLGSNPQGVATGIWQSLGYWLAQQEVARGSQPWYYFFVVIFSYEFISMSLLFVSILVIKRKYIMYEKFLIYWIVTNSLIYCLASEKMPWLTVHLIVPIILYVGCILGEIIKKMIKKNSDNILKQVLIISIIAILGITLVNFVLDIKSILISFVFVWILILILFLLVKSSVLNKSYFLDFRYSFFSVLILVTGVLTFRGAVDTSFYKSDIPDEIMVYTQTSPHVHNLVKQIELYALENGQVRIAVDTSDGYTWPWAWYLRRYDVKYFDLSASTNLNDEDYQEFDYIIINSRYFNKFQTVANLYDKKRELPFRMWFPESYRMSKAEDFFNYISSLERLKSTVRYIIFKELNSEIGQVNITVLENLNN